MVSQTRSGTEFVLLNYEHYLSLKEFQNKMRKAPLVQSERLFLPSDRQIYLRSLNDSGINPTWKSLTTIQGHQSGSFFILGRLRSQVLYYPMTITRINVPKRDNESIHCTVLTSLDMHKMTYH